MNQDHQRPPFDNKEFDWKRFLRRYGIMLFFLGFMIIRIVIFPLLGI